MVFHATIVHSLVIRTPDNWIYNCFDRYQVIYTVKPVYAVTFIKQSPVLTGHLFLVLSSTISYELILF
jgi:hypothetical protein